MKTIIHELSDVEYILEEVYNSIYIIRDRDSLGCEVMRDASISQESYQRTKCLTHQHHIYLRKERLTQNQHIESERKEMANLKLHKKITHDDAIVGCLCKKLELCGLLSNAEIGTAKEE
jgi:hypothetical protein